MHNPLDEFLAQRALIVMDGALATELERRGAELFDPLWSAKYVIERPDLIRAVHGDYFNAGADLATTATYQATFDACHRRGMDHGGAVRLMREAVALAIAARDEFWEAPANRVGRLRPLVAASIGPYGAMLADGSEYRGHYALSNRGLEDFHRERLQVLAESGADLLAFETIPCLREARVLAQLLQGFPAMSAWISFSCRDGRHNCEGEPVADCAAALQPFTQIAAIGINCTLPEHVSELLRRMASQTDKPLVAYPNSGEHYDAAAKIWNGQADSQAFAGRARTWYEAGARLIGGCCRTTPDDIRGMRMQLGSRVVLDAATGAATPPIGAPR